MKFSISKNGEPQTWLELIGSIAITLPISMIAATYLWDFLEFLFSCK